MRKEEQILAEMEKILHELIFTAEKLCDLTTQVIAKEELAPLQQQQEKLLQELAKIDAKFKKACKGKPEKYDSPSKTRISELLDHFQKVNATFIQNLKNSKGIIQFEEKKKKKK